MQYSGLFCKWSHENRRSVQSDSFTQDQRVMQTIFDLYTPSPLPIKKKKKKKSKHYMVLCGNTTKYYSLWNYNNHLFNFRRLQNRAIQKDTKPCSTGNAWRSCFELTNRSNESCHVSISLRHKIWFKYQVQIVLWHDNLSPKKKFVSLKGRPLLRNSP